MAITRPDASQIAVQDERATVDGMLLADRNRPPFIIAHRGFSEQGPQNTLLAFSRAANRGASALECDISVSSDGVLYCFHDATVDALTTGTGTFTALASSYLESLSFDELAGTALADLGLTRFETLLAFIAEKGIELHAELKNLRSSADIPLVVDAIVAAGVTDLVTLIDGSISSLQAVRALNESIAVGFVGSSTTVATYQGFVNSLANLGRASLVWLYSSLLSAPAIVTYARSQRVDVVAWTVPNQENMRRLMRIGVRKIISDVSLVAAPSRGMDLPAPLMWTDGFTAQNTGDGLVSIDGNGIASLSSGVGSGSAYLVKYLQSTPGETFTFSVVARRISGVDDTSGAIKVEWPEDSGGEESVCFITSSDWREYEVTIGSGPVYDEDGHFNIAVGTFTADGGQIQAAYPRMRLMGSRSGALRCHAYGLVRFDSGVPVLDADYVTSGISAVAYDAPSKTLTLTTPRGISGLTAGAGPLLFCQITTESAVAAYSAKIGEYSRTTGQCKLKFYDASGAEADVSGIPGPFYVSVMLVL